MYDVFVTPTLDDKSPYRLMVGNTCVATFHKPSTWSDEHLRDLISNFIGEAFLEASEGALAIKRNDALEKDVVDLGHDNSKLREVLEQNDRITRKAASMAEALSAELKKTRPRPLNVVPIKGGQ